MKAVKLTVLFFFLLCQVFSQSTASKQVSTFIMEAPQLHTQKKIWVYLPKAYHDSKKNMQ